MSAYKTNFTTSDGLAVYDLDPQSSELWAVAGPDGFDPKSIDPENLPDGFRWVENTEWEKLNSTDLPPTPRTKSYTIMSEFDRRTGKWFHSVRDSETDERVRYQDDRLIDANCDSLTIASDAARFLNLTEPAWVDHVRECIFFGYNQEPPVDPA